MSDMKKPFDPCTGSFPCTTPEKCTEQGYCPRATTTGVPFHYNPAPSPPVSLSVGTQIPLASLRKAAYDANTGHVWTQVGNTFYWSPREGDWEAIPGGITMVRHFVASQPVTILALLDEHERLLAEIKQTRESLQILHDWFNERSSTHPDLFMKYWGEDVCAVTADILTELTERGM